MLVTALGYGQKADALGGYPTGHFRIARSLGILKGLEEKEGPLTVKEAYTCVYNALYADKVVLLDKKILKQGSPNEVFNSKEFKDAF